MKTAKVQVGLGKRSYDIRIGAGLLAQIGFFLREAGLDGHPWAIISDDQVGGLYANQVRQSLTEYGIHSELLIFPHGEASKRLQTVEMLAKQLLDLGFDRNSGLLALGGGVTGDLTGFLASIYMRGIPFVQVPTTLLAQVDSSVGGKTGVDMEQGKNLLGTFYQPLAVFIDTNTLSSLPKEEFAGGMAEVIKYGVILDTDFFAWLDQHAEGILALEPAFLMEMISRCCAFKAQVVEQDEREDGFRRVLNFGHTIGHALELVSGYRLSHGHAVAIGMCAAASLSVRTAYASATLVADISALVRRFGLPTTIPAEYGKATLRTELWAALKADKKKQGDRLVFVLPERIGKVHITDQVQAEDIDAVLSRR